MNGCEPPTCYVESGGSQGSGGSEETGGFDEDAASMGGGGFSVDGGSGGDPPVGYVGCDTQSLCLHRESTAIEYTFQCTGPCTGTGILRAGPSKDPQFGECAWDVAGINGAFDMDDGSTMALHVENYLGEQPVALTQEQSCRTRDSDRNQWPSVAGTIQLVAEVTCPGDPKPQSVGIEGHDCVWLCTECDYLEKTANYPMGRRVTIGGGFDCTGAITATSEEGGTYNGECNFHGEFTLGGCQGGTCP
jgi:hypothetical protein